MGYGITGLWDFNSLQKRAVLYLATVRSYCPSGVRGGFIVGTIVPLLYVIIGRKLHIVKLLKKFSHAFFLSSLNFPFPMLSL